jgi:hypothetical protein
MWPIRLLVRIREKIHLWHGAFKTDLQEYKRINELEWLFWGTRRAEREARYLGAFGPSRTENRSEEHLGPRKCEDRDHKAQ